jgi:hypothetical protein
MCSQAPSPGVRPRAGVGRARRRTRGQTDVARREYTSPFLTLGDRLKSRMAGLKRWMSARSRRRAREYAQAS